jgi:hypothetical protein
MPGQEQVALYSPNGYQQRPSSACSQIQYHQQMQHQYGAQPLMTPVQSPQPLYQKPTILVQQDSPYMLQLDTDCYAPSTPPLSTSGSAVSSPPSTAEILPTPINHTFYGQPSLEMMKSGREEEAFSEILAGDNWNKGASPPMTPGTFFFKFYYRILRRWRVAVKQKHCVPRRSRHGFKAQPVAANESNMGLANLGSSVYPLREPICCSGLVPSVCP